MEPESQSVSPSEQSTNRAAGMIGVAIAILTLIAPLAVIAYYSGGSDSLPSGGYALPQANGR